MFESPRKSTNRHAWSESQEELRETQPVSPLKTGSRGRKKKRKQHKQHQQHPQRQQRSNRSVSIPRLRTGKPSALTLGKGAAFNAEDAIVKGIFEIEKKSCDVVLTATRVIWTPIEPETPTGESGSWRREEHVELRNVFAVKVKRRRSVGQQWGGTLLGLTLFCCVRKGAKLKERPMHLNNLSADHCEVWFRHLKDLLSGFQDRPKSLMVFVNPTSHRKEAYQTYRDEVAPLFKLADIKADVTVTKRRGHALAILREGQLDAYDGVVCVGGDGSVAEVAHALLLRAQMDAGRDTDSIFTPVRAALPLGVIPAGSTDIVACSVHGISHPVTAAMHIIMGHRQAVDVSSFSSQGRLIRFGFSCMFGFGGRTLALAEKHRWMPPSQRLEFAVIRTLANLKPEDCELSFLSVKQDQETTKEPKGRDSSRNIGEQDVEDDEPWVTIQGLLLNISIMAIPCLCSMAPRGLAPNTRLDNGSMSVIAVRNASRSEFIKHLKRYGNLNNQFGFPFVETHTARAVRLRPRSRGDWAEDVSEKAADFDSKNIPIISSEVSYPWNIDGDLLEVPGELLIRVHPQLILLFGVNTEEVDDGPAKCGCI
ncbi:ceramide kinase-like protein isoform X2 [Paramormyrops kingsleyae]|uniref:ceramide kinase-like protein isoform X2 n=1 Tax=Paramormyrops kingsleyae TaxID=1676925 RepID=UPI003B96BED4